MFLISKIVRGRRLMHELEHEEATAAAAAAAAAASLSVQLPRKKSSSASRASGATDHRYSRRLSSILLPVGPSTANTASTPSARHSVRRKGKQQKESTLNPDSPGGSPSPNASANRLRRTSSLPSVPIKFYNYDAKMTKFQKRSLRFTWHRLQTRNGGKRVDAVFEEVFERVLKLKPSAKDMFTTRAFLSAISRSGLATMRDHARATVRMVDMAIRQLDKDEEKREWVEKHDPRHIGRQHNCLRVYGFKSDFWEVFGEVMVDVVLAQEAVRDLPGAGQAWVVLTACLIDQLRAGFEEGRSSNLPAPSPRPTRGPTSVLRDAARHLDDTALSATTAEKPNLPILQQRLRAARSMDESAGSPSSPSSPTIAGCSSSSPVEDDNRRPNRSDSDGSPHVSNDDESPSPSSTCPFAFVNIKKTDASTSRLSIDSKQTVGSGRSNDSGTPTRNSISDRIVDDTTSNISKRLSITTPRENDMDDERQTSTVTTGGGRSPRSSIASVSEGVGGASSRHSTTGGRPNSTTFTSGYPINGRQPIVCQEFAKDKRPTSNCLLRPISELDKNLSK